MECVPHVTKKARGVAKTNKKNCVIFLIVQHKVDRNAVEHIYILVIIVNNHAN